MTWAWATPLPPTPKLVLLALADIVDDTGSCWPSQNAIAAKCSITTRTVQRIIVMLHNQELLIIEPRYRADGSRSSNRYRLPLDTPHDKLSGGGDTSVQGATTPVSWGGDTHVVARTTTEPSIESPLPPPTSLGPCDSARTDSEGGGGDLFFPKGSNQSLRDALLLRLAALIPEQAQQVLDELAGRMAVTGVKNPVRYCAVLIERMRRGEFVPELGLEIATARAADIARKAERARIEQVPPGGPKVDPTKLPKKLREAVQRAHAKSTVRRLDEGYAKIEGKKGGAARPR
jgi:hypothetical protein